MGNPCSTCKARFCHPPQRPENKNKWPRSLGAVRTEPKTRSIDISNAVEGKWVWKETEYGGSYGYSKKPEWEEFDGTIQDGLDHCKESPELYEGIVYQSNMKDWPEDQQTCKLLKRTGSGYVVKEQADGGFTYCENQYQALPPADDIDADPLDDYTDSVLSTFQGQDLGEPKMPGRGQGIVDIPGLKIIGEIDPDDILQGGVGDCWMLSAISAVAEFDGAISKIFAKNRLGSLPKGEFNSYTVTLYDLPTWEPVDVVVDERLCTKQDGSLLGSQPSIDGELWVPILEKALAAHCGGWDAIDGGQCTHAWRLLIGSREQYTIKKSDSDGKYHAYGAKNANSGEWEDLENSPHDGFRGLWPMDWPEVGGGGGMDDGLDADELFERMCAWDDNNFLLAAGTMSGSDSDDHQGIVDGHAYTVLTCLHDIAGSGINLIKVRNPWGKGEFQSGKWDDDGEGWQEHPEVEEFIQPVAADDGSFWMEPEEFFQYFHTVYLCAEDMGVFITS